jgi:EAL domain-containing protein (putative c-di-GMP-specific phosphodiesterase class I)
MQYPPSNEQSQPEAVGHRNVAPRVCIADGKAHIRTFLAEALEELGFVPCECAGADDLSAILQWKSLDLVVIGSSGDGMAAGRLIEILAANSFAGKVMTIGPRESVMIKAVQKAGEHAGIAMLPSLHTPFSAGTLRDAVAELLPQETAPAKLVDVAEALQAGWLELWYQHKIDARTLVSSGAEAMLRMRHPHLGVLPPTRFMDADSYDHIRALSEFVVLRAIKDWRHMLAHQGPVDLSVNLPVAFLEDPRAVRDLCSWMPADAGFGGLIVELKSAEMTGKVDRMIDVARQVRPYNIAVSIDGLGADWPLLMHIDAFPFVELKVDRQYVTGCADDRLKQTVCRRIVELAAGYGARTVATGIETRADYRAANELGFDLVQGYLFGKPAGVRKFARSALLRPLTASG